MIFQSTICLSAQFRQTFCNTNQLAVSNRTNERWCRCVPRPHDIWNWQYDISCAFETDSFATRRKHNDSLCLEWKHNCARKLNCFLTWDNYVSSKSNVHQGCEFLFRNDRNTCWWFERQTLRWSRWASFAWDSALFRLEKQDSQRQKLRNDAHGQKRRQPR